MIVSRMNYWVIPAITKLEARYEDAAVKNAIYEVLGIRPEALEGKIRKREIVFARQIYCYLMTKHTDKSLKSIGMSLGGRDHSTVIHSNNRIADALETEKIMNSSETSDAIRKIEELLIIM